jgi:malic enzyme
MRYLFFGGGGAAIGIAELCIKQMETEGMDVKKAHKQIYFVNTKGIVTKHR